MIPLKTFAILIHTGALPEYLQQVSKRIMGSDKCSVFWRSPSITARMVCTYVENGRDSCHGDSGSTAVLNGVQVGIVSFGSNVCGDGTRPAVYVRVEDFEIRDFIRQHAGI